MKVLLNLGCGMDIRPAPGPGWVAINHDRAAYCTGVDEAWDLNKRPWPWHDGSIHILIAQAVLEHLDLTLIESLNECWRILKVGGRLDLKLPLWNSAASYTDPTHRIFVAPGILENFDPDYPRWEYGRRYGALPWRLIYEGKATTSLIGKMTKRPVEEGKK